MDGRVVPGRHSWMLGRPDTFAAVMAGPLHAVGAADRPPTLRPAANE